MKIKFLFFVLFFSFIFTSNTFAVTINVDDYPHAITSDPFNIKVNVSGAKSGTNYLRIELYKDGSTNYFGETFNTKDWYGGSDGLSYLPVNIAGSSTSATIEGRLGNPDSSDYLGSGNYKLKIKRYTASGNGATDTQNPVDIAINYNLATPTPVPTVLIPSITTSLPTNTPISTSTPIITPEVLAINTISTVIPTSTTITSIIKKDTSNSFPIIPAIIFAAGLFLVGIGSYLLYNRYNAQKNN